MITLLTFITIIFCSDKHIIGLNNKQEPVNYNTFSIEDDCNISIKETYIEVTCKDGEKHILPISKCSISILPKK